MAGGILRLLGLIQRHRGAIEYDFRRLGFALSDVGHGVSILEAARLAAMLERDQATWTYAAVGGWDHPWSQEAELMATLIDLYAQQHYEKPGRIRRPWGDAQPEVRGDMGGRSAEENRELLRRNARGPNERPEEGEK